MTENEKNIHKSFLTIAKVFSDRSYAKRNKVGCVIVNSAGRIVSTGFNGTPSGVDNCCEKDENTTHEYVIHAELNAIFNATTHDLSGSTVYITLSPCLRCAAALKQKNVSLVIYDERYRNSSGIDFLNSNGIPCKQIMDLEK